MSASAFAVIKNGMVVLSDGIATGSITGKLQLNDSRKVFKISDSSALTWTAFTDKTLEAKLIPNVSGCGPKEAIHIVADGLENAVSANGEMREIMESNPEENFFYINSYGYINDRLEWWRFIYSFAPNYEKKRKPEYIREIVCPPPDSNNIFSHIQAAANIIGFKGNTSPWQKYIKDEIMNHSIISGEYKPIESLEVLRKVSFEAFSKMVKDLSKKEYNVGGKIFMETITPSTN